MNKKIPTEGQNDWLSRLWKWILFRSCNSSPTVTVSLLETEYKDRKDLISRNLRELENYLMCRIKSWIPNKPKKMLEFLIRVKIQYICHGVTVPKAPDCPIFSNFSPLAATVQSVAVWVARSKKITVAEAREQFYRELACFFLNKWSKLNLG